MEKNKLSIRKFWKTRLIGIHLYIHGSMHSFCLKYQLDFSRGDDSFLEPSSQKGNKLLFYIGPLRGNGRA